MATIQINNELLSAAKVYREAFLREIAEAQAELDQLEQEGEAAGFFHMARFLYQLAEAVIHTENAEG